MMKRRFKKVMSYFFNFDSVNTPKKKSRRGTAAGKTSREHLETESQYVIRKLSEANRSPRGTSFSRYTPLPRIGEAVDRPVAPGHHMTMASGNGDASTSHVITYNFSPVRVKAAKVTYQLSPLPDQVSDANTRERINNLPQPRPKLKRQGTYVLRDPVFIKGSFLEYLRSNDNMVTTRVHQQETSRSTSKRNTNAGASKCSVAKVSNSKKRLSEIKAKFKRQKEEERAREHQGQSFWLDL